MTTASIRPRIGVGFGIALAATAIIDVAAGLFGTGVVPSFALWLVAAGALIAGVIGVVHHARWGLLLLTAGAALLLGSGSYVVLGLIQPDGPACGGTGCVTVPVE